MRTIGVSHSDLSSVVKGSSEQKSSDLNPRVVARVANLQEEDLGVLQSDVIVDVKREVHKRRDSTCSKEDFGGWHWTWRRGEQAEDGGFSRDVTYYIRPCYFPFILGLDLQAWALNGQ